MRSIMESVVYSENDAANNARQLRNISILPAFQLPQIFAHRFAISINFLHMVNLIAMRSPHRNGRHFPTSSSIAAGWRTDVDESRKF
jgi:hypothetical protein